LKGGGREVNSCLVWRIKATVRNKFQWQAMNITKPGSMLSVGGNGYEIW
jgi:hypothetical protein